MLQHANAKPVNGAREIYTYWTVHEAGCHRNMSTRCKKQVQERVVDSY